MSGLTNAAGAVVDIIAVIVGIGGISATVWAVGKVKGLELTVALLKSGNEALRAELIDNERRYTADRAELARTHAEQVRTAAERIARVEGQNAALVNGVADRLASAIGDRLEHAIADAIDRLGTTLTQGAQR